MTNEPLLKLNTKSAVVGQQISISGSSFTPNSNIQIKYLSGSTLILVDSVTIDNSGNFDPVKFITPPIQTNPLILEAIDNAGKLLTSVTIFVDTPMPRIFRIALVSYFFASIVFSVYLLSYHWQLADQQVLVNKHPQIRFILLAGLFGLMGSSIHGVSSLTVWAGHHKLGKSWGWWYLVRPPIGVGLAIIVYFVLRAGLLSGSANFSYYGVAAMGALAGLSTEPTMVKLRDVLDKLFGVDSTKKGDKAEDPSSG